MSNLANIHIDNSIDRYTDYDEWAWLYNQTAGPAYKNKQLEFLNKYLLDKIPNRSHILDLCCGTGQLMQPLIDKGFQLSGLDGSEKMLSYAKINAPDANLLLADARSFTTEQQFSAIISTSASLNHIPKLDDLYQIFQQAYNSLTDEAYFIFDINHQLQMSTHWNKNYAGEGQINKHHAWLITPSYDKNAKIGKFKVNIYKRGKKLKKSDLSLNAISRFFLSRKVFNHSRLMLLKNFSTLYPSWEQTQLSYNVYAHDLSTIKELLNKSGFDSVKLMNITGDEVIDENHSAYFICHKKKALL